MSSAEPESPTWDLFLAHASNDEEQARELYDLLRDDCRVFLDTACIEPGVVWSKKLLEAQHQSRITVALISNRGRDAYYADEEIQRGVALHRAYPDRHRVVPVYLDGRPASGEGIPYGLWLTQDLDAHREGGLEGVARRLRAVLKETPTAETVAEERLHHILHRFPRGPMVEGHHVRSALIEAFAQLIPSRQAAQVIEEANAFRREADPKDCCVTLIRLIDLPDPLASRPRDFWTAAFDQARLHGPRMLAALVLSVPPDLMPRASQACREQLLRHLQSAYEDVSAATEPLLGTYQEKRP